MTFTWTMQWRGAAGLSPLLQPPSSGPHVVLDTKLLTVGKKSNRVKAN